MKKKAFSLALATALCTSMFASMPVCAADTEVTTEKTVEATVTTGDGAGGADSSVFIVAIPQTIELNRTTYQTFAGTYETAVKAVLASGKKVKVQPASTFDMVKTGDSAVKYPATVTQEKTVWVDEDAVPSASELIALPDSYTKSQGSISVDIKKTGSYSGQLGFTVTLE